MELKEALKLAVQFLWANKLCSVLTLLGNVPLHGAQIHSKTICKVGPSHEVAHL